jgi:hypothetical protein
MRRVSFGLAVFGSLLVSTAARAEEPFAIDLEVRAGKASKTAHAETAALGVKPKQRGVLEVKAGDRITVKWKLSNIDPKATFNDVTVHFFAVREEKAGQQTVPKLNKDVAAESALTMDFAPKDKTEGEMSFTIDKAGCYLLRLETIGAAKGTDGHEWFAALDVKVP